MKAPEGLDTAGKALWAEYASVYSLRPDELVFLASACKAADRHALVEREWIGLGRPYMSKGSMGQEVTHPLFAEMQKLEAHQASLLARIKLPDDDAAAPDASQSARKAASARWSHGA